MDVDGLEHHLARIAKALEGLTPASREAVEWSSAPAFLWDGEQAEAIASLDALPLSQLRGIAEQKRLVCANVDRLAKGHAAHDMLLWGARGMGKSALIRAAVKEVQGQSPGSPALVQVPADKLTTLPKLMRSLDDPGMAVLLYVDDLGFGDDDSQEQLALRSLLDGGVVPRRPNVRIAVTSNRRAILARDSFEQSAMHERDERDNALALADRFGLTLAFHPCDRETYLDILRAYTEPSGLSFAEEEAMAWAIARGNRSGRTAYQFAVELAGRAGKPL